MRRCLLVLSPYASFAEIVAEGVALDARGVRWLHRYGTRVAVVDVPPGVRASRGVLIPLDDLREPGGVRRLATAERLGWEAVSRGTALLGAGRAPRWPAEWSVPGVAAAVYATSGAPMGRVAVTTVFAQGPTAERQFGDEERARVLGDVFAWLAGRALDGDGVCWCHDVLPDLPLPPETPPTEAAEATLVALGVGRGEEGVREHLAGLRAAQGMPDAMLLVFTRAEGAVGA